MLKLVSSNKCPTRKISPEGLEAIRAFLAARSAMYQSITDLEEIFKTTVDFDEDQSQLFHVADSDFSDWPCDKEVSLADGNKFIQQLNWERPIDDEEITQADIDALYAQADSLRLRLV